MTRVKKLTSYCKAKCCFKVNFKSVVDFFLVLGALKSTVKHVYNDNLGTQYLWPLLTAGRCSEVALCYEN